MFGQVTNPRVPSDRLCKLIATTGRPPEQANQFVLHDTGVPKPFNWSSVHALMGLAQNGILSGSSLSMSSSRSSS